MMSYILDEEKNGYVARDQLLYALRRRAGLMPGVTDKASARGHVGTRPNQGSHIDNINSTDLSSTLLISDPKIAVY